MATLDTLAADRRLILGHNAHIPDFIIERVLRLGVVRMPDPWEAASGGPYDAALMPRVLNKRNLVGPAPKSRYIGRPSSLGNSYQIGRDGNRRQVIEKHLDDLARDRQKIAQVRSLAGYDLICWCDPLPCHGHPLLLLANWPLA